MAKKYTKTQTAWWLLKRFLRTTVPQIPAMMAAFETVFPSEWFPVMVALGGVATAVDKVLRDKGWY